MIMSNSKFISLRDIPHEFIITMGEGIHENDLRLFFDFKPSDIIEGISLVHYAHFDKELTFEELAVILEQQPSKGQARKNGWLGKIPQGYTEIKRKFHKFYILNLDSSFKKQHEYL